MIHSGNANIDGTDFRQWIVGSFMPANDIRQTDKVEIKWGTPAKGFSRGWTPAAHSTTISILVSGIFVIEFRDRTVELSEQGDYVMWNSGTDHRSEALEDSVVITVRWTS